MAAVEDDSQKIRATIRIANVECNLRIVESFRESYQHVLVWIPFNKDAFSN